MVYFYLVGAMFTLGLISKDGIETRKGIWDFIADLFSSILIAMIWPFVLGILLRGYFDGDLYEKETTNDK